MSVRQRAPQAPNLSTSTSVDDDVATVQRAVASTCCLRNLYDELGFFKNNRPRPRIHPRLPPPSKDRLEASLSERAIDTTTLSKQNVAAAEEKEKTFLYLAYGSNLCNETFRGKRGIKPISQINVQVPSLRLTFDLPGIPYVEPCFANSAIRDPDNDRVSKEKRVEDEDYHKDRWHKGLIGCVYEVTPSDYAHIIATEGGGASYHDVLVDCYPLADGPTVPQDPAGAPFKAHTLFAPPAADDDSGENTKGRFKRPDPSYAQPSARYLKLITDGATELSLPDEYQIFLSQIRPYTITTAKQRMGQALLMGTWFPFFMFIFALQPLFQDEKGRSPKWLAQLSAMVFLTLWKNYDVVYKQAFGDGERTIYKDGDDEILRKPRWLEGIRSKEEPDVDCEKC